VPHGIQLTAMSETRSLQSLRVMPLASVKLRFAVHYEQVSVMA